MLAVCVSSLPQNTATSTRCAGAASPPDLAIDAGEVDPLVEPAPDPVVAGVGNKMREAADVFVIPGFQPIAPDHLHRALLAAVGDEPKKQPRRMVVAFARALVERAIDLQRDVPAPSEHRIGDEIDIDIAKQHRRAVPGFAPHARQPVYDLRRAAFSCQNTRPVSSDPVPEERLHDKEPRPHHGGVKGKVGGPAAGT